ncbi:MAG: 4Fe-4S dicluster domain-containing protein [Planctomycetes bacterium]|nr:4Fe-4S dicluster domain-containing protein [Planctomycetota bacterium]
MKSTSDLLKDKLKIKVTKVPKGELVTISERCKGCEYCISFCPKAVLAMSPEYNSKGYHYPLVKSPELCSGCNNCGLLCPDFAIYIKKSKGAKTEDPGDGSAS